MFTNVKKINIFIANDEKNPKPTTSQYVILYIIIRIMKVIPI